MKKDRMSKKYAAVATREEVGDEKKRGDWGRSRKDLIRKMK